MMVIKMLEYGFGTLYTYQPKPPSMNELVILSADGKGRDQQSQGVEVIGYQVNNH